MDNQNYYKQHGMFTKVTDRKHMVTGIPNDINSIAKLVQNFLLHQHCAPYYGVKLSTEQTKEPHIRSFEDKLELLEKKGYKHISDYKDYGERLVGICRDFAVLSAALCREAGIPARARCGFATYLEKGKYIDHWVLEYWNKEECRWTLADTQLDDILIDKMNIDFDSMDLDDTHFVTGAKAWNMCRRGKADPQLFGIFQWWGYGYITSNLLLDANSLIKRPMQPWDMWEGYKTKDPEEYTENDWATLDKLVELVLNVDNDWQSLYDYITLHNTIKVPDDIEKVKIGL